MSEQPEGPAGEAEAAQEAITVEVSMDTLDELLGAWGTCVGANEGVPGTDTPDAMGLILTYLPAVLEMAREFLLQQPEPAAGRITRTAHRISDSGVPHGGVPGIAFGSGGSADPERKGRN